MDDKTMPWPLITQLILEIGLPATEAIFKKWNSGVAPSQADFDELRGLASQTALDRVKARLVARGIALDSPEAIKLIELAQ